MAKTFSDLPSVILALVLNNLASSELASAATTSSAVCTETQRLLFSRPLELKINEEEQAPLQSVCSFLYTLLTQPQLRKHVQSLDLDFGCHCADEVDDAEKQRLTSSRELAVLQGMSQLWSRVSAEDRQRVAPLVDIFGRFDYDEANMHEPHVWYRRAFMLMLCFVPDLRNLKLVSREWGHVDAHGFQAMNELYQIVKHIATHDLLPQLESLKLDTWAGEAEWNLGAHPFCSLASLPSLSSLDMPDIFCIGGRDVVHATNIIIRAPGRDLDGMGGDPEGMIWTERAVENFLKWCESVNDLEICARDLLSIVNENGSRMILTPVAATLQRLTLVRPMRPDDLDVTNFSSLRNLQDLRIDWHFITANAWRANGVVTRLGSELPDSLQNLAITNEGNPGDSYHLWHIPRWARVAIVGQIADLVVSRASHWTAPALTITMDVHRAYRAIDGVSFDTHGRSIDFHEELEWKREMRSSLRWVWEHAPTLARRGGVPALLAFVWRMEKWGEVQGTGFRIRWGIDENPVWMEYW